MKALVFLVGLLLVLLPSVAVAEKERFSGTLYDKWQENGEYFFDVVHYIFNGKFMVPIHNTILVDADDYTKYDVGDYVEVSGYDVNYSEGDDDTICLIILGGLAVILVVMILLIVITERW